MLLSGTDGRFRARVAAAVMLPPALMMTFAACAPRPELPPAAPVSSFEPDAARIGEAVDEESGSAVVSPRPAPPWGDQQRATATAAAEGALAAFARPGLSAADWWSRVAPLLTKQAQQDYQHVDPSSIPAAQVTGGGTITDETSTYVVSVGVPTDAGVYVVVMTRLNGDAPWRVARFTPPDGTR